MKMYESPINLYTTDITTQVIRHQEEQILKAVQSIVVDVNHEELFRALKYDRGQYEKGYQDGMADAKPKWIPVAERLPEDDLPKCSKVKQIKVLTALKSENGARMVRSQMRFRCTWYTDTAPWAWKYSGSEITHWMPLPKPPQEVDNG